MELTAVAPVWLSLFLPVRQVGSSCVPADWEGSVWHPSPSRQVVVYLSGRAQITASDGMVREFGAAVVLLLEDTTGRGHSSRGVGEPMCHVVVQLPHDPR